MKGGSASSPARAVGIGREYALVLARQGAKVVVNDLGGSRDGTGADAGPAQEVVDEINAAGGEAVANTDDISSLGRRREPRPAGDRHVRRARRRRQQRRHPPRPHAVLDDRGGVGRGHQGAPQGHLRARPPRGRLLARAVEGGRDQRRAASSTPRRCRASTATSGQTNYGAAKAGIAAFTQIAAQELERYGVTVNAIAPGALTRMTEDLGLHRRDAAAASRRAGSRRWSRGWRRRSRPTSPVR